MDSGATSLFDLEDSPEPPSRQVLLMTDQQRVEIRSLFGQIGVGDVRDSSRSPRN